MSSKDRWRATQPVYRCAVNFDAVNMQFERRGHDYDLAYGGSRVTAKVLSPRAAELHAMMPVKAPPRPLALPAVADAGIAGVAGGGSGREGGGRAGTGGHRGDEMENSLRAEQDGVVEKVLAEPGTTLDVDQPILEFAPNAATSTGAKSDGH